MTPAEARAAIAEHFDRALHEHVKSELPSEEDVAAIRDAIRKAIATSPEPIIDAVYDPETHTVNVTLTGRVDDLLGAIGYTEDP